MVKGRCMSCKRQVEILDEKEKKMKNGRKMLRGHCRCGTTVCRILGTN